MKKGLIKLVAVLYVLLAVLPGNFAKVLAEDLLAYNIEIMVNGKLKAKDVVTVDDYPELEYGSLPFGYIYGDVYGQYQSGSVKIDGKKGNFFCFDGENGSVFTAYWSNPEAGNYVVVTLNYAAEEAEEQIVYGSAKLNISDGRKPAKGIEAILTGKKGAEVVTLNGVSDENGIIEFTELDTSYTWKLTLDGYNYNVDFDQDNKWYSDFSVKVVEERKIDGTLNIYVDGELFRTGKLSDVSGNTDESLLSGVIYSGISMNDSEGNKMVEFDHAEVKLNDEKCTVNGNSLPVRVELDETATGTMVADLYYNSVKQEAKSYTVSVLHQFSCEPGTMVNGVNSSAKVTIEGKSIEVKAGEEIYLGGELFEAEGFSTDGEYVILNGDRFSLGTFYVSGGSSSNFGGSVLGAQYHKNFTMINDDVKITLNYRLVEPIYSVTVNYLDADTNEAIRDSHTNTYLGSTNMKGDKAYDVNDCLLEIEGYQLAEVAGDQLEGNLNGNKEINLMYQAEKYTVTVKFVDEEENEISESVQIEGSYKSAYDLQKYEELEIEGYEYLRTEGQLAGSLTSDMEIKVVFSKKAAPVIEEPVIEEPVIEEPVIEEPVIEEPVIEEPVIEEPVIEEPVIEEPVIEEPVIEEPVIEEPVIEEPVIEEPVIEEPVIEEPVIEEPVVEEPIIEEPVIEEPVVEEPIVVEQPTKPEPKKADPKPAPQPVEEIVDTDVIEDVDPVEPVVTETIDVVEVPLAENSASWALANLLSAIATGMIALYAVLVNRRNDDEEQEKENTESRYNKARLITLIPAVTAVLVFLLTENMSNPMVLFDEWTLTMVAILFVSIAMALLIKDRKEEEKTEENSAQVIA